MVSGKGGVHGAGLAAAVWPSKREALRLWVWFTALLLAVVAIGSALGLLSGVFLSNPFCLSVDSPSLLVCYGDTIVPFCHRMDGLKLCKDWIDKRP